jgi:hypothetical protein
MPVEKKYDDWEEAAINSKRRVAISHIPGTRTDIVKPLHGNPYFTNRNVFREYPGTGKATTRDVDRAKDWLSV